jgi:hypothetical protein
MFVTWNRQRKTYNQSIVDILGHIIVTSILTLTLTPTPKHVYNVHPKYVVTVLKMVGVLPKHVSITHVRPRAVHQSWCLANIWTVWYWEMDLTGVRCVKLDMVRRNVQSVRIPRLFWILTKSRTVAMGVWKKDALFVNPPKRSHGSPTLVGMESLNVASVSIPTSVS